MEKENIDLENLIEKKFRNVSLEIKIISYILQKDCKIAFFINVKTFTIEPFQVFLQISRKNKMEYPKKILWQTVKEMIEEDEEEIYISYIKKIYNADLKNITVKNIEKLCSKLLEHQNSRKFIYAISDTISDISQFNLEKTRFKFRNLLLNTDVKIRNSINYVKDFEKRRDHLKEIAKNPKKLAGVPTGIKEFDDLSGGLAKTEFGIIIAGTGVGKSLMLGNFALNAFFQNYNVVIATLEMTNEQYAFRLDSRAARIDFSKFRKSQLDIYDYERWESKISGYKKRKNNFLRIVSFPRGSTIHDIESECYKIQSQEDQQIHLMLLDYINLVAINKTWEAQTDTAWEIKELSQGFNEGLGLPIWTAGQLTDEGKKSKKITTSHVKYARGVAEAAPIILAIAQNEEDKIQDIFKMYNLKCRDFPKQESPMILYPNFKYMEIDDSLRREME